ncbi:hypothetical protein BD413DRAFT_513965 [Trametes elegans]|nr:hypothetical protein BD413DRAFT_513965 [Trametes elegans]
MCANLLCSVESSRSCPDFSSSGERVTPRLIAFSVCDCRRCAVGIDSHPTFSSACSDRIRYRTRKFAGSYCTTLQPRVAVTCGAHIPPLLLPKSHAPRVHATALPPCLDADIWSWHAPAIHARTLSEEATMRGRTSVPLSCMRQLVLTKVISAFVASTTRITGEGVSLDQSWHFMDAQAPVGSNDR